MKRVLILSLAAGAMFAILTPATFHIAGAQAPQSKPADSVPRLADGHPDLSGVWWGGADVGAARGGGGARGGAARGGGARAPQPPSFTSLYKPEAAALAKTLSDKDDPT